MKVLLIALVAGALAGSAAAEAPLVPGYGAVAVVEGAYERPDPARTYRLVFDVSKGAPGPGRPSASNGSLVSSTFWGRAASPPTSATSSWCCMARLPKR